MSTLLQLNYQLFQQINVHAGVFPWLDALMVFCANALIFCFPLLLFVLWGRPLTWRKRALQSREVDIVQQNRAVVLWVGVACGLSYLLNFSLEHLVSEPRPFVSHNVHLLVPHPADASFPSDHTAWSFAVVGMLLLPLLPALGTAWRTRDQGWYSSGFAALLLPFLLVAAALLIACSIGLARIFVGLHYPGDILGGAVDGLVAACVVTAFRRWLHQPTQAVLQFAHRLRVA